MVRDVLEEIAKSGPIVVVGSTGMRDAAVAPQSTRPLDETADYRSKNAEAPRCVRPWSGSRVVATFLPQDMPNSLRPGWNFIMWFEDRFGTPNLYQVSRVGFSNDGLEAMLSYDMSCGILCGGGGVLRARKHGTHWVPTESVLSQWVY